jgi:membrane protein DedA with SNARE-associated domain
LIVDWVKIYTKFAPRETPAGMAQTRHAEPASGLFRFARIIHLANVFPTMQTLNEFIHVYGYVAVALIVGLECLAIPLPGELVLISASIYAGRTGDLNIVGVIAAAAFGGFLGNIAGFVIGRLLGQRMLLRYGTHVGLNDGRIKIGQYLFQRHGAKVVVAARFVAGLRSIAGILAGANRMDWLPFLLANALGAVIWATLYGGLADLFGDEVHRLVGPVGLVLGAIAVAGVVIGVIYLARREAELLVAAERAFPGPLKRRNRRH